MTRVSWILLASSASLLIAIAIGTTATSVAQDRAPSTPSTATARPTPTRPEGIRWADSSGRDCHVFHGRRMCEGPRRVPVLDGEALRRAERLGLVGPRVARLATAGVPPAEWVEAARAGGARATDDLLWPVPEGRLWRGFGPRQGFRRTRRGLVRTRRRHMHQGVDIGAHQGSLIVAVADGLVAYSDNRMSGYGNAVLLVHADGAVSMYAHCVETYVVAGQVVRRGEVIAAVGQTGIAHGAHLHFEYRERGHTVDPYRRFTEIPELPPLARAARTTDPRIDENEEPEEHPSVEAVAPESVESPEPVESPEASPTEPPAVTEHDAEP
jgi:murein DD-endopeptidase MepM/ murein hydrolase activator NlpD